MGIETLLIAGAGLFLLLKMKGDTTSATTTVPATPPATPPPTAVSAGATIYPSGGKGRVKTAMNQSGGQCASAGIRFNISNDKDLVNRETTFIFTVTKGHQGCTDKPYYAPEAGSHGDVGQASCQYIPAVNYAGGLHNMRAEGPHLTYKACSGFGKAAIPALPVGKPIAFKIIQWVIAGGAHVESWYDFTGGGKGPWHKYMWLDDSSGKCGIPPCIQGGVIRGVAKTQETMRLNGATAKWIGGSIREIAVPATSKSGFAESIDEII
jgi:hypothetical protein